MSPFKSRQYCSVCKQWLEMEVVPTGDGDEDDGVIWFRCPQCQGFLPKLSGADAAASDEAPEPAPEADGEDAADGAADSAADDAMPWDSPAEMMAERARAGATRGRPPADEDAGDDDELAAADDEGDGDEDTGRDGDEDAADAALAGEPLAEYAALLAGLDPATAVPYRPWETYEVGQCVLHVAWDDCGVVVAKEDLPGGRKAIKCYFADAGVVRLIENAPR